MNKYNYTVIIPHKNSLDLLRRCVNSIPNRRDIQIVIVDDNSDIGLVDWSVYLEDNRFQVVFTTEGKGAGFARNVGLKYATGRWVLFADCDDYYIDNAFTILDRYIDKNVDVIYFNHVIVDTKGNCKSSGSQKLLSYYNHNKIDSGFDVVRFRTYVPWNKMTNKSFINHNKIHFEEVINGNDIFYSLQVGYLAKAILVENEPVYCYYVNNNSLTRKKKNTDDYYRCIFGHRFQTHQFHVFVGHNEWHKPVYNKFIAIFFKKGLFAFVQALRVYVNHLKEFESQKNAFVNYFKTNFSSDLSKNTIADIV